MQIPSSVYEHPAIADPALKHELEHILAKGFRLLRFPAYLERYFAHSYQKIAVDTCLSNSPYIGILFALMGVVAFTQYPELQSGLFLYSYLLAGLGLISIYWCARLPATVRWFSWYVGFASALTLLLFLVNLNVLPSTTSQSFMQPIVIYSTILIYAIAKMRFYNAILWCQLAALFNVVVSTLVLQIPSFDWQTFLFANSIGIAICYVLEHRERTLFLQRLLLDIEKTEQQQLNRNLQLLSRMDSLTNLANRRYFSERLTMEWKRCMREQKPLSVVLLDIDYFKQFNDCYGHLKGDHCLVQVAKALKREASRPAELVGRYGGEEFILLYPNVDEHQIKKTLVRIQQRIIDLAIPHHGSAISPVVTASLGAATVVPHYSFSPEKLVSEADHLLYQSKERGRNCWLSAVLSGKEHQHSINL